MKKITSEHLSEDDNLVKFLQTHAPKPPSEKKPCEELVMRSISLASTQENIATNKKCDRHRSKLLWLLPITVITAVLMLSNQLWKQNKLSPEMVSRDDDMDTFMIDTWYGSMAEEVDEDFLYMSGN